MPKVKSDYSKCIIYKIQHIHDSELFYIDGTTQLHSCKYRHKVNALTENYSGYNQQLYKMIQETGGWELYYFSPIKVFPCETKLEMQLEVNRQIDLHIQKNNRIHESNQFETAEVLDVIPLAEIEQAPIALPQDENMTDYNTNNNQSDKKLCICGCYVTKRNWTKHNKTTRHKNLVEQLNSS